jgi:hypothetical protein
MEEMLVKKKRRHWFATGYLIIGIIVNSWLFISFIRFAYMDHLLLDVFLSIATGLLVISFLAFLSWKKWGVYTFFIVNILMIFINMYTNKSIGNYMNVIEGDITLLAFLFIGSKRKIWPQLE